MNEPYQFGLIGYRVAYSRSKQIFEIIFRQLGVKGSFTIFDIASDHFENKTRTLFDSGVQAVSITIPYKKRIMELLADTDPIAKALDAVNSVCMRGTHLYGFNTDAYGFAQPLHHYSQQLKQNHAVIFGCGGSAKAAVYSLYTDFEVRTFSLFSRSQEKLSVFAETMGEILPEAKIHTITPQQSDKNISGYAILVNCTPLGGWNHPNESPFPNSLMFERGKLYYDLNYNDNNLTIQQVKNAGMIPLNGSAMLVAQAVRSLYLWTGIKVDEASIYKEVFPS